MFGDLQLIETSRFPRVCRGLLGVTVKVPSGFTTRSIGQCKSCESRRQKEHVAARYVGWGFTGQSKK